MSCPRCGKSVAEDSAFCSACGHAVSGSADLATQTSVEPLPTPAARLRPDRVSGGRFLPGQTLAERYRIVGLLGRGGMGEVYRADDLRLGEPVALKFLPKELSSDPARLDRFVNEARVARQVTHPNVCRVHDLGVVDGQHFISMEYVDGEDLDTLLQRIGRVPEEKAVQIARQLCAGLAAAHEQGILHRDLKPANIMLDGKGRVRVTDFGLAGLAEELVGDERAGTPAYQSPEQLAGREVTVQSDIYAVGLVLYELFTGKRAFDADSAVDLKRQQQSTTPASVSSHVAGLDDSIERVIQRCLAPDPRQRPDSLLTVAAALPGGDPLAAALAAGETPSPEMVVNAGETGALKLRIAVALLLAVAVGFVAEYGYRTKADPLTQLKPRSPAELRLLARQILEDLGHQGQAADSAGSFERDQHYLDWVEERDAPGGGGSDLAPMVPRPAYFWYRESPYWLKVGGFDLAVTRMQPVSAEPGAVDMRLDTDGRLLELRILPPAVRSIEADVGAEFDWTSALEATGLDLATLQETQPLSNPPLACDRQQAWHATYPDQPEVVVRLETCSSEGRPAYLEVLPPWREEPYAWSAGTSIERPDGGFAIFITILLVVFVVITTAAVLLARRNWRLDRADRQGALRLAVFLFALEMAMNLLEAHHGPFNAEVVLLLQFVAQGLLQAMLGWTLYLAVEPFVRRHWPQGIVAWRRLLDGRFRDPLVGRDILIGAALAQVTIFSRIGLGMFFGEDGRGNDAPVEALMGIRHLAEEILDAMQPVSSLVLVTFLVLIRIVVRRDWLTWLIATSVPVTLVSVASGQGPGIVLGIGLIWASVFFGAIRFGLLTLTAGGFFASIANAIRVWEPSEWYFPYVVAGLMLFLAPAVYGFFVSLGGRKLFDVKLLDG